MLERLPYYGVFDYIVFRVDRGTVYLAGYTFEGRLQMRELAARRASGVVEVANKIQVLSMAPNDDRIRRAMCYRIYTDDFPSRYAPGGVRSVARAKDDRHFAGMTGRALHDPNVVKNGRTMLLGVVDSAADPGCRSARAPEVSGVFELENGSVAAR